MLKLSVTDHLTPGLTAAQEKQIPFAASLWLNLVALDGQAAERRQVQEVFHLRRAPFILNTIKIEKIDRATKSKWSVVIRIPVDRDELSKFEDNDYKLPSKGKWIWEPNKAVFGDQVIGASNPLNPKNLAFSRSKGGQLQGPQRTFMVHKNGSRIGPLILQRTAGSSKGVSQKIGQGNLRGPAGRDAATGRYTLGEATKRLRRGGVRLLFTLVQRVRLPVRLRFHDTITGAVIAMQDVRFREAWVRAVGTAR